MHVYYVFGLLLIFLLSVSYSISTTEDPDNYWKKFDDDDSYDDYYSDEKLLDNSTTTSIANNNNNNSISDKEKLLEATIMKTTPKSDLSKATVILTKCPDNCDCDVEFLYANCSSRNLDSIPKKFPISLIELDLSQNLIRKLHKNDFNYLVNLRKIELNSNEIETLDQNIFIDNKKLHTINLSNNKITKIDPNTFVKIPNMSNLDLSNNIIEIPKTGSFLNAPELEILILRNCSINEIYDDTFRNTTGLIKLMLDKNNFNKKINTQAFNASMQNLVKLTLPELEESYVLELCQLLKSIDNISFKNFDLSCFEIVAGLSFNESLISAGTQIPIFHEKKKNENQSQISNINSTSATTKHLITKRPSRKNMNITNEATEENILENNAKSDEENSIQIPAEIINYCLFAIMGLAVIGLIIGVIFRKDIYGIKTKLCRTSKTRGPTKTDQVKPTEEIPLNKV